MRLPRLPRMRLRASPPAGTARIRDRFELLVPLGHGGFGTVWEGFDMLLERPVAIKEISLETRHAGATDLALREARATAKLNHPGIVSLYEVVHESGRLYLVSELVDGSTLAELIEQGGLADHDVAVIGGALCEALAHAHGTGVVHRDVKPANVIVPREWCEQVSGWRAQPAKLMDFGIAAVLGATGTGEHLVAGSEHYAAPEQAAGDAPAPSADVYSLAAVLYECFAGGPPASRRRRDRLAVRRPDLPATLSRAIDDALAPQPDDRPSLATLTEALADARPHLADTLGPPARLRALGARALASIELPAAATGERIVAATVLASLAVLLDLALAANLPLFAAACGLALGAVSPRLGPLLMVAASAGALAGAGLGGAAVIVTAGILPAALAATGVLWRGALGALAAWWVLACGALANRALLLTLPAGLPGHERLLHEPAAGAEALIALAGPPALATFAVWALAAHMLPWVANGPRRLGLPTRAACWAGVAAAAQLAAAVLLGGSLTVFAAAACVAMLLVAGVTALARRHGGRVSDGRRDAVAN